MSYADALRELYQTAHERFVTDRKRLADELRAAGDRAGAAKLVRLPRPTIAAWAVNQLYWHARGLFDEMLAAAKRLRDGDLSVRAAHQDALAKLRQRAANMLSDAGHSANEATLRRVTTNLSAIAAIGSFEPDPEGALAADRDAPGFDAVGQLSAAPPSASPAKLEASRAQQLALRRAERERVAAALRTARGDLDAGERRVQALRHDLQGAQDELVRLRAVVDDLERALADSTREQ